MVVAGRNGKGYVDEVKRLRITMYIESSLADWVISQRENMHLYGSHDINSVAGKTDDTGSGF